MSEPHETLRNDQYLGPLVESHGQLTIEPAENFYQRFVVSILRQQVSMASAAATRQRLFEAVDVTPAKILATNDDVLRDAGLSRQKARYVKTVAEAFIERGWSKSFFSDMSDETALAELTDVTGVGDWTARMQLMFSLGRADIFPVGDLGVRKGMETVFDREMTRAEMVEAANRWAPYRSYASLYLWRVEEDIEASVSEVCVE